MERPLIREIEQFLKEQNMPPTTFGRRCANDPRLVSDLRIGREPGGRLQRRVRGYMAMARKAAATGGVVCLR